MYQIEWANWQGSRWSHWEPGSTGALDELREEAKKEHRRVPYNLRHRIIQVVEDSSKDY